MKTIKDWGCRRGALKLPRKVMFSAMKHIIYLLVIILGLSGCGLSKPLRLPPESTFTITSLEYGNSPLSSHSNLTILISPTISNPGYDTSSMIYVLMPFKLRPFANNRWVAPPGDLIGQIVTESIRNTGFFKAVVTPPFAGFTDYHLDLQLIMLQQEFFQPISEVRLVMQATLINNNTHRAVASRRFQVMVAAPENDPYGGVIATNKAANVIAQEITSFIIACRK